MPASQKRKAKLIRVIDGDTVEVAAGGGIFRQPNVDRIRLYGIDAPESAQKGGKEATRALQKMCGSPKASLWLQSVATDQYGRTVGTIWKRGTLEFLFGPKTELEDSLNYRMVLEGQAECYMVRGAERRLYQQAEKEAREERRGIWRHKDRQSPRNYRRDQREAVSSRSRWKLRLAIAAFALATAGAAYAYFTYGGRLGLPGISG